MVLPSSCSRDNQSDSLSVPGIWHGARIARVPAACIALACAVPRLLLRTSTYILRMRKKEAAARPQVFGTPYKINKRDKQQRDKTTPAAGWMADLLCTPSPRPDLDRDEWSAEQGVRSLYPSCKGGEGVHGNTGPSS